MHVVDEVIVAVRAAKRMVRGSAAERDDKRRFDLMQVLKTSDGMKTIAKACHVKRRGKRSWHWKCGFRHG